MAWDANDHSFPDSPLLYQAIGNDAVQAVLRGYRYTIPSVAEAERVFGADYNSRVQMTSNDTIASFDDRPWSQFEGDVLANNAGTLAGAASATLAPVSSAVLRQTFAVDDAPTLQKVMEKPSQSFDPRSTINGQVSRSSVLATMPAKTKKTLLVVAAAVVVWFLFFRNK